MTAEERAEQALRRQTIPPPEDAVRRQYERLLEAVGPGVALTERQDRHLRWLARWDEDMVEAAVGVIEAARRAAMLGSCDVCDRVFPRADLVDIRTFTYETTQCRRCIREAEREAGR